MAVPAANYQNSVQLTANSLRANSSVAMAYGGRAVGARAGVRMGGTQLLVTLVGSTITVAPGCFLIDPGLTAVQGPYWAALQTADTHTLTVAAASPRKDAVVAEILDVDERPADVIRTARTRYITGTPGSGALPTLDSTQLLLCQIDVPASGGGPAVPTDRRVYTAASGGIISVADIAERDAIAGPWPGMAAWVRSTPALHIYGAGSGGGWGRVSLGTQQTTTAGLAGAAGWDVTWFASLDWPFVDLTFAANRTGATITPDSVSNVTGDPLIATIPVGWRPWQGRSVIAGSGSGDGEVRIETNGQVLLRSFSAGSLIDNTTTLRFNAMYRVP